MAKAKRPVTVAGIQFDALISEERSLTATVPTYSVESGFCVSDAIILEPETLSMVLFLTDTPVTWRRNGGRGKTERIVSQLEELYYSAYPVTIVTSDKTYTNMAITSLGLNKSTEIGYAREIPIEFQKIRITTASTTTIPDSYGKSGTTGAQAGTASVTTESTSPSTGASTSARDTETTVSENGQSIARNITQMTVTETKYHNAQDVLWEKRNGL